jgi:hypothetical protein
MERPGPVRWKEIACDFFPVARSGPIYLLDKSGLTRARVTISGIYDAEPLICHGPKVRKANWGLYELFQSYCLTEPKVFNFLPHKRTGKIVL